MVVVTNQRGIARIRLTEADLTDIHDRTRAAVARAGGRIDAIYHCPHEGGCECRKPGVALFREAARDLNIELTGSAVVGDRASDMEAAAALGALRVLVGDYDELPPAADHVANDLAAAAECLVDQRCSSSSRTSAS